MKISSLQISKKTKIFNIVHPPIRQWVRSVRHNQLNGLTAQLLGQPQSTYWSCNASDSYFKAIWTSAKPTHYHISSLPHYNIIALP